MCSSLGCLLILFRISSSTYKMFRYITTIIIIIIPSLAIPDRFLLLNLIHSARRIVSLAFLMMMHHWHGIWTELILTMPLLIFIWLCIIFMYCIVF